MSACEFAGGHGPGDEGRRLDMLKSFPLNAHVPDATTRDGRVVGMAQWILAGRCMVRLGGRRVPTRLSPGPVGRPGATASRPAALLPNRHPPRCLPATHRIIA
ncbi:hypothetical protein [Streptomyces sp. NRRL S-1022]|uniref:hypothetical protein n=1 Tax=Streptomyces sp. NRRL S-1022 TaxID=1463880 RepID=UPI0004BFA281|nr:hypothetical protein [Streptomyces sp. NRRL S-1022]